MGINSAILRSDGLKRQVADANEGDSRVNVLIGYCDFFINCIVNFSRTDGSALLPALGVTEMWTMRVMPEVILQRERHTEDGDRYKPRGQETVSVA
ncbi:hypothetical protein EMCRGX_G004786 [Ephydatia muelleri]